MHNFKIKTILRVIAFIIILSVICSFLNYSTYDDNSFTRLMMNEMYETQENIDVVFAGSSITYRHYDPEIWDEALNLYTFNAGSSSQTVDATYYLMKEIFKTSSPKYCIFGTSYVSFLDIEAYENPLKDYILFDFFKPSINKLNYAIHAFKDNLLLTAFIPYLRNDNFNKAQIISSLKNSEEYISYSPETVNNSLNTYLGKGFVSIEKQITTGEVGKQTPYKFADSVDPTQVEYFKKLVDLCEENDCELIMMSSPFPYSSMGYLENYQDILDFYETLSVENNVTLFDFSRSKPDTYDIKDSDFYDHVHLNYQGSTKYSNIATEIFLKYIQGQEIDMDSLFYNNYQEILDANQYIYNVWLEKKGEDYVAYYNTGSDVTPEFRFSYIDEKSNDWVEIQAYSAQSSVPVDLFPETTTQILIQARTVGSTQEYEQQYILVL